MVRRKRRHIKNAITGASARNAAQIDTSPPPIVSISAKASPTAAKSTPAKKAGSAEGTPAKETGAGKGASGKKVNPALMKPLQPSKELAAVVGAHLEPGRALRLHDERRFRHARYSLNGIPRCASNAFASSSVFAVVTMITSMPRTLSILS